MKAIIHKKYGTFDALYLVDMPKPEPEDNEIIIKIHATTVSIEDTIFRNGKQFFARMFTGPFKPKNQIA